MTLKIRRVAILGAGVMGAQMAAVLAAAGVRVHLLDLMSDVPPSNPKLAKAIKKGSRSVLSELAIENLKKLKPPPLYTTSILPCIIPGNFDDDMSVIADCDWVIEAVVERLDIKHSIHKRIAEYARPGIPITTNTSGISLSDIVKGLPEDYQKVFFGTHFFNPPRYMKLLEIIPHDACDKELLMQLTAWIMERLGKGIVFANDTVNFIANRIGVFANQATLKHMAELKLNIETVDALTGKTMGRPPSASLRTMDVVGLDTFALVAKNTYDRAPNDPYRDWFLGPDWIEELIKDGAVGQKADRGCYKKTKDKGQTKILAYRPDTKEYVEQDVKEFAWQAEAKKERDTIKRLKFIIGQKDEGAELIWRTLRDVFSYSACLLSEISGGSPKPIDDAIRWGFNWEWGPFELWQALGYDEILVRMQKEKSPLPKWIKKGLTFYSPEPASLAWHMNGGAAKQYSSTSEKFQDIPKSGYAHNLPKFENKEDKRTVMSNKSASLLDLGHGVACLVFHSKMNSIDDGILELAQKAIGKVGEHFQALVIGNEGEHFSAGANLAMVLGLIKEKKWNDLDQVVRTFQGTTQLIKFAPFPTVSCPHGLTLGGGCEIALAASKQLLAAETYTGLVELGVGLVPAGGGTKELALRAYNMMSLAERGDPMHFLQRAFMLVGMGQVMGSGYEAIEKGLYPQSAMVSMSKDHLIERAKHTALHLVDLGYAPPIPQQGIKVAGDPGIQTFKLMLYNMAQGRMVSPYDAFLGEQLAIILCGGEVDEGTTVDEQWFLDLERRVFVDLCKQEKTAERIEHMLKTGKPLRN